MSIAVPTIAGLHWYTTLGAAGTTPDLPVAPSAANPWRAASPPPGGAPINSNAPTAHLSRSTAGASTKGV